MKLFKRVSAFLICQTLLMVFINANALASGLWNSDQVRAFHQQIQLTPTQERKIHASAASTVKLPISPDYDQGGSGLCWVYATLNAIESNYLNIHPNSAIALSRVVMQSLNMEDRYQWQIRGIENNVSEGGTAVDAIAIIHNQEGWLRNTGLFVLGDFSASPTDADWTDPLKFKGTGSVADQVSQMDVQLDQLYGAIPKDTHDLSGNPTSPAQLADEVILPGHWVAYAIAGSDHPVGIGPHFDQYARKGSTATYIDQTQFIKIFSRSLRSGHALVVSWYGHDEEIYGADFDKSNNPILFYIKGSYPQSYEHTIDANRAINGMMGVTTYEIQ